MTGPVMLMQALVHLGLTTIVEWAVVSLLLRRCTSSDGLNVLVINSVTNPLAHLGLWSLELSFWFIESLVLVAEVGLFRLLLVRSWSGAIILATAANLATALLSFTLAA